MMKGCGEREFLPPRKKRRLATAHPSISRLRLKPRERRPQETFGEDAATECDDEEYWQDEVR